MVFPPYSSVTKFSREIRCSRNEENEAGDLFYKRAYEDSSQNALWHYMLEYFVRRYTELVKEKLGTDVLDTQLAYSI